MEQKISTGSGPNGLYAGYITFTHFLLTNKVNKKTLLACGVLIAVQFAVFKILYPFASFMPDSSAYIEAAINNYTINLWPIGYSWFLAVFGLFSHADTALVFFQFLLLQTGGLYFVFTIFYFLQPQQTVQYVLLAFFVLNPLFLVIANYVSADALFIALSFIWATQLLWLLYKPSPRILLLHVVVLLLAFTVRFNSLYYPLVSAVVIMASGLRLCMRLTAAGMSFSLIAAFSWYCSHQYKVLTGKRQLAAFAGWQLAGNALYAYSHSNERIENVPVQFAALHRIVNHHIDSLSRLPKRPDASPGIYYQWQGPLMQYFMHRFPGETNLTNFKHYSTLAPLYKAYGIFLIRTRPAMYMKYFLRPNLVRLYAPPAEFLGRYNINNQVNDIERQWFGYRNSTIKGYSPGYAPFEYMTVVSAIINLVFAGSLTSFAWMRGFCQAKRMTPFLLLIAALWMANTGFSVLASPIVLRYQLFILSLTGCAGILLTAFIYYHDTD